MRIGIPGSGDVGRKLADSFIENKHLVKICSRNPKQEKLIEWMAKHDKAKVSSGTFAEAASFGELDLIVRNNGRPTDFALDDIRGIAAFDDTFKQRCIQYFQAQLGFVNLANGRIQLTQPGRNNCNQYH